MVKKTPSAAFLLAFLLFTGAAFAANTAVALVSPDTGAATNNATISFVFVPQARGQDIIIGAQLWTNATGTWAPAAANASKVSDGAASTISAQPAEGSMVWNVNASVEAQGRKDWGMANENYTLTIDRTRPLVTVENPEDGGVMSEEDILLLMRASELANGSFVMDGNSGNTTMGADQTSFSADVRLDKGQHRVKFYAKDRAGNTGKSAQITFQTGGAKAGLPQSRTGVGHDRVVKSLRTERESAAGNPSGPAAATNPPLTNYDRLADIIIAFVIWLRGG